MDNSVHRSLSTLPSPCQQMGMNDHITVREPVRRRLPMPFFLSDSNI